MGKESLYDDKEMLLQIAEGNEGAMKMLFDRFYPRLYYFALKLTQDETEAQDEAQEAFVAFWNRKETFRHSPVKEAEAFMITVVRNRAYNFKKHMKVRADKQEEIVERHEVLANFVEAQIIQEDIFNRIYQELSALSPSHVELLKMIFIEDLGTAEIAERLNTTPNNVRNQKARALEKLKTLLLRKGLYLTFYSFLKFL